VILDRLDALPAAELKDLIAVSYEMIAANASIVKRPFKYGSKSHKSKSSARRKKR
jgi:hypothetical protein